VTKFVGAGPTPEQLQLLAAVSVSKMYFRMFNAAAAVLPVKYYPPPLGLIFLVVWAHFGATVRPIVLKIEVGRAGPD